MDAFLADLSFPYWQWWGDNVAQVFHSGPYNDARKPIRVRSNNTLVTQGDHGVTQALLNCICRVENFACLRHLSFYMKLKLPCKGKISSRSEISDSIEHTTIALYWSPTHALYAVELAASTVDIQGRSYVLNVYALALSLMQTTFPFGLSNPQRQEFGTCLRKSAWATFVMLIWVRLFDALLPLLSCSTSHRFKTAPQRRLTERKPCQGPCSTRRKRFRSLLLHYCFV